MGRRSLTGGETIEWRRARMMALSIALIRRRLGKAELARKIGVTRRSLSTMCGRMMESFKTRQKIEEVLGEAIWTTPSEWQAIQEMKPLFGGRNPYLIGRAELQGMAAALGIPGKVSTFLRAELIQKIVEQQKGQDRKGNENSKSNI